MLLALVLTLPQLTLLLAFPLVVIHLIGGMVEGMVGDVVGDVVGDLNLAHLLLLCFRIFLTFSNPPPFLGNPKGPNFS